MKQEIFYLKRLRNTLPKELLNYDTYKERTVGGGRGERKNKKKNLF